ncbi:MAG: ribonuclease P protein component 4 [Candidatus Thorarchaeota archaeon]
MPKKRNRQSDDKRLAMARIRLLWKQALEIVKTDSDGARTCMQVASRIAQRVRIKVPREIKRKMCRRCGTVLIPGESCRVRMRNNRSKHLTVTCIACGNITRYYVR